MYKYIPVTNAQLTKIYFNSHKWYFNNKFHCWYGCDILLLLLLTCLLLTQWFNDAVICCCCRPLSVIIVWWNN